MTHSIGRLDGPARAPLAPPIDVAAADKAGGPRFQNMLLESLQQAGAAEHAAHAAVERSLTTDDISQAEVFSAVRKADLALRMMLQIRNRLVEAYDEIKNLRM